MRTTKQRRRWMEGEGEKGEREEGREGGKQRRAFLWPAVPALGQWESRRHLALGSPDAPGQVLVWKLHAGDWRDQATGGGEAKDWDHTHPPSGWMHGRCLR